MIIHFHKAVFVHIPKNAGQSVESAFLSDLGLNWENRAPLLLRPSVDCDNKTPPRLAHLTGSQYVDLKYIPREMYNSYYKFAICRNPWDRAFSLYKYLTPRSKPFAKFVKEDFEKEIYKKVHWFSMSQAKYILGKNEKLLVDKIIRFETLAKDFKEVATKLKLQNKILPHINKSKESSRMTYKDAYCEDSKKIIADIYADDIQLFQYSFE